MNKQRRKRITEAIELLEQAQQIIEEVKDEEQEAYDNLPEGLQCGERGEAMKEAVNNLEESYDSVGDIIDTLEAAQE